MSDYQALKTELVTDPLGIGYGGMNNAQAANALMTTTRDVDRTEISRFELYEAISDSEFEALTANNKARVRDLYLFDWIATTATGRARAVLWAVFGAGSVTRGNLINLVRQRIRRCEDIGWLQGVTEHDVAAARALP